MFNKYKSDDTERLDDKNDSNFKSDKRSHSPYRRGWKDAKISDKFLSSRRITGNYRSGSTEVPGYITLSIIGKRTKDILVRALGVKNNQQGYLTGEQKIRPSTYNVSTIPGFGNVKGILGGVRLAKIETLKNENFCFFYESNDTPKIGISIDTDGYSQNYFKVSQLLSNTQATYLPLAQALLTSVTIDGCSIYDVKTNRSYLSKMIIGAEELKGLFKGTDERDLLIYIYSVFIDMNVSLLAKSFDNLMNIVASLPDLRQKFWSARDVIDNVAAYTNRNTFSKPFSLAGQVIKSKKLSSHRWYDEAIAATSGIHSESDGADKPVIVSDDWFQQITSFTYTLSGTTQTKEYISVRKVLYQNQGEDRYREDTSHFDLLHHISKGDQESAIKYLDDMKTAFTSAKKKLQTEFSQYEAFLNALDNDLGFKEPKIMLEMGTKRNFQWSSVDYWKALTFTSKVSYNITAGNNKPHWYTDVISHSNDAVGITYKLPVNSEGGYPALYETDGFYRTVPASFEAVEGGLDKYYSTYCAGLVYAGFNFYDHQGIEFTDQLSVDTRNYAYEIEPFIDFMKTYCYSFIVNIVSGAVTSRQTRVNSFLYYDDTMNLIPNAEQAYNFGFENNPITNVTKDQLIR